MHDNWQLKMLIGCERLCKYNAGNILSIQTVGLLDRHSTVRVSNSTKSNIWISLFRPRSVRTACAKLASEILANTLLLSSPFPPPPPPSLPSLSNLLFFCLSTHPSPGDWHLLNSWRGDQANSQRRVSELPTPEHSSVVKWWHFYKDS